MLLVLLSLLLCLPASANSYQSSTERERIIKTVWQEAIDMKVDPALALSVAEQESSFNPLAKLFHGGKHQEYSLGIFQLLPASAKILGFKGKSDQDLQKIPVNIHWGLLYLKKCQELGSKTLTDYGCCFQAGHYATKEFCGKSAQVQAYVNGLESRYPKWDQWVNPQKVQVQVGD